MIASGLRLAPLILGVAVAPGMATLNAVFAAQETSAVSGNTGQTPADSGTANNTAPVAAPAGATSDRQPVGFTEEYLNDPANIEAGKALWQKQCRHCHGKAAYPGKAPKLKPRRYTPDFVYDRVTYGFRKMPAWEQIYSQEERMAMVAFVLSRGFSP